MKLSLRSILVATVFSQLICAQTNFNPNPKSQGFSMPEISRPSPGVAQLMKIEETTVSHYTGQPNISVPLFNKNIDGFNYSLGLNYNVTGIRPEDYTGWVGRGWSLEGSGAVSRTVQDLPDELNTTKYKGVNHTSYYDVNDVLFGPNSNYNTHNSNVLNGSANEYFFNSLFGKNIREDNKRDIYQFNALGRTGRFIFIMDDSDNLIPELIGDKSSYLIEHELEQSSQPGNQTQVIKNFTITDSEGYKFYFDQIEESRTHNLSFVEYESDSNQPNNSQFSGDSNFPFYRTAWKLSSVKNNLGIELLNFEYNSNPNPFNYIQFGSKIYRHRLHCTESPNSYLKSIDIECPFDTDAFHDANQTVQQQMWDNFVECVQNYQVPPDIPTATISAGMSSGGGGSGGALGNGNGGSANTGCDNALGCSPELYEPIFTYSNNRTTVHGIHLSKITFRDSEVLEFTIHDQLIHPEYSGGIVLDKITYKTPDFSSNGFNLIESKNFKFNQTATISNSNANQGFISEMNDFLILNSLETHYGPVGIGASISSHIFDYNSFKGFNEDSIDDFGYYKNPDDPNPKIDPLAGSLRSISYPTNGKKEFIWEANTYSFKGDKLLSYSEILSNPDNQVITNPTATHTSVFSPFTGGSTPANVTSSSSQVITVPYDQYVTMDYDITDGMDFIFPYNVWIWYEQVDPVTGNLIPDTLRWIKFDNAIDSPQGRYVFRLEAGIYQFYLKQNIFEPQHPYADYSIPINSTSSVTVDLSFTIADMQSGPLNWWLYGGGIRVKAINNYNNVASNLSQPWPSNQTIIDYSLENNQVAYPQLSPNGYPLPSDYPGHVNNINGDPVHFFSSGSIDGESKLIRKYLYRKAPLNTLFDASGILTPFYYAIEKRSALANQMTQNSFIGYKNIAQYLKIRELQTNVINSKPAVENESVVKFTYDSPIDSGFHPENYVYPFPPYEVNDFLRGNLRSTKIYSKHNKLLKETYNNYNYDLGEVYDYKARDISFSFNPSLLGNKFNLISKVFDNYQSLISISPSNTQPATFCGGTDLSIYLNGAYPNPGDIQVDFNSILQTGLYYEFYKSYKVQLTKTTTKSYYFDGTETVDPIYNEVYANSFNERTIEHFYNSQNYQLKSTQTQDSKGDVIESKTFYPVDAEVQNEPHMDLLISENKVNTPILNENYVNGELTNSVLNIYRGDTYQTINGPVTIAVSDQVHTSKGDEPLEPRLVYHRYDEFGNILEVSKKDGTRVSYIYGHSKTLPIAKIEGLSYEQLASKLAGVTTAQDIIDTIDEDDLPTINNLRDSFTVEDPFMVTTYEYEVGIGIKKVTDPRGRNMYYEYDDFNRLKAVRDHEGNILSENEYKYATQN